jgi:cell division protein FtsB
MSSQSTDEVNDIQNLKTEIETIQKENVAMKTEIKDLKESIKNSTVVLKVFRNSKRYI